MEIDYPVWKYLEVNIPIIEKMTDLIHLENFTNPMLVCTGSSGLFISSIISYQFLTPIEILYLRKSGEYRHGHGRSSIKDKQLIIVDDFINTGETIQGIIDRMNELYGYEGKFDALCVSNLTSSMRKKWEPHFKKILTP